MILNVSATWQSTFVKGLRAEPESQLKPYIDLPTMATIVQTMVKESLDAFVKEDVQLALKVTQDDEKVDSDLDQIFRELLT